MHESLWRAGGRADGQVASQPASQGSAHSPKWWQGTSPHAQFGTGRERRTFKRSWPVGEEGACRERRQEAETGGEVSGVRVIMMVMTEGRKATATCPTRVGATANYSAGKL